PSFVISATQIIVLNWFFGILKSLFRQENQFSKEPKSSFGQAQTLYTHIKEQKHAKKTIISSQDSSTKHIYQQG
ncbi:MAG: hypothetical protein WC094_07065, partial [Candidatus Cloacimonas sp.]